MIALGNGEPCPFCQPKLDKVFILQEDSNFLEHLQDRHPGKINEFLFGDKSIGL